MSNPPSPGLKTCPNCNAPLVAGRPRCISCGMERSKMAEFLLAKKNAESSIRQGVHLGGAVKLGIMAGVTAIILLIVYALGGFAPRAEPWKAYPNDRTALVQKLFEYIATDDEKEHDKAYALISRQVKDPNADDERGAYRQVFHEVAKYLTGEFGPGWVNNIKIDLQGDPGGAMMAIVTVETDKLHVPIQLQLPPSQNPNTVANLPPDQLHFGADGIQEFPLSDASKAQQVAVMTGVLKGYGADNAANQILGIANAGGSPLHETPFECKRRLLPIVRNPHIAAVHRALYQLWPIRKDPTVQRRLNLILDDDNYPENLKDIAKKVKEGTADEEVLIGEGVNNP